MYLEKWRDNFRHPTYRKNQEPALDKIAEMLDDKRRFVVAEIPTGVGKSDIAMALARSTNSAYIATSLNTLIDQYTNDFGSSKDFWYIKGRNNYKCVNSSLGDTCKIGSDNMCAAYLDPTEDGCASKCTYKGNRDKAASKKVALTNLTYFSMGLRGERWVTRNLAVIDEAHNLAGEIMNQVSMIITDKTLKNLGLDTTVDSTYNDKEIVDEDDFSIFLEKVESETRASILRIQKNEMLMIACSKDLEIMEEVLAKMTWYKNSRQCGVKWVIQANKPPYGKFAEVTAKPLHVNFFAQNMFFKNQANQYLLQSATIVNAKKYTEELGIESYGYVEEGSPFELSRFRPVFMLNSGKMAYKDLDSTFPNAMKDVRRVIDAYQGKRGIIHTTSYALQKRMYELFQYDDRCIFMTPENKTESLLMFSMTPGAVLFSPTLMEGFDGKGDLLRFQVIMKIPYASLADLQIKMKKDLDPEWYTWQAVKAIIQALGRGMRSEDDWCDTYVIDSAFRNFADRNLPREILRTLIISSDVTEARLRKMAQILV